MGSTFLGAIFALSAAASWGSGDFAGGLAARRSDPFRSVLVNYTVGLIVLTVLALARAEPIPPARAMIWGAVAGLFGMVGILFLFRGFAMGRMGIVAPVSAVLATILPVIFNAMTAGLPGRLQLAGFVIALVGIWLLSRPERLGKRPEGLGMAILAGMGFAGFFISLDQVGQNTLFWPLAAGRLSACSVLFIFALVTRKPILRDMPLPLLTLAGVLDVAGNFFFLLSLQNGRLDVTAVLGSLYPAVTAILARLMIKEHLTRQQAIGVSAAVLAIVLITV